MASEVISWLGGGDAHDARKEDSNDTTAVQTRRSVPFMFLLREVTIDAM
jgi:hypothetical protein